jgi:hypothetical protein
MSTSDYLYRFNSTNPKTKRPPADAAQARKALAEVNRLSNRWMASCPKRSYLSPRLVLF